MTKLNIKKGDIPETDEEVEKVVAQMEKKATRKPTVARKNKKVVVLDVPDQVVSIVEKPAVEAVVLDGNLQPATGKTKKALLRREKTVKAKAEKKAAPAVVKDGKASVTGRRIVEVKGQKQTIHGHRLMTPEIALDILKRQEAAEKAGVKLDRKALSAEINIAVGTIADVVSGQPVIVKMLAKAGHAHPHPRNENGSRVGQPKQASVKDTESETIDGVTYHVE